MATLVEQIKGVVITLPQPPPPPPPPPPPRRSSILLSLNAALLLLGIGGPLLLRLYFTRGGTRMWLSSFLQICGWPLLLLPLSISFRRRRRLFLLSPRLLAFSVFLGLLLGLDCYLYAYGSSNLPLSTSSLLVTTQLPFTAVFALLIVHQRFTAYSVNSVMLLTVGAVVLGMGAGGDRPAGESRGKYYLGFAMTLAASALIGLVLPLMERAYRMAAAERSGDHEKVIISSYDVVMELQLVMGVAGTAFCLVGMLVNKDFQAIASEAREFELGEVKYYMVLIWDAIFWQFLNLGQVGVISCASSLLAGILLAVMVPMGEVLAVILFQEKFSGSKGVALALSLWGFASYLYGEMKQSKKLMKLKQTTEVELPLPVLP